MNRSRYQFFAGAGFTYYQDGAATARRRLNPFIKLAHGRVLADQCAEACVQGPDAATDLDQS